MAPAAVEPVTVTTLAAVKDLSAVNAVSRNDCDAIDVAADVTARRGNVMTEFAMLS